MASQKRIFKDFKAFTKEPVGNCFVRMSEKDVTCWDAFIILNLDEKFCPLHLKIRFPADYPQGAPSVGFSCSDFGYTDGAVYVDKDRDSHFYGKLIICLDILGNFAHVHGEWASTASSGWSPAYTVSSLLQNVLVTLAECTSTLSKSGKDTLLKESMTFLSSFDTADFTPAFTLGATKENSDCATFRSAACEYLFSTGQYFSGMLTQHGEPPTQQLESIASTISDRLGALLLWMEASEEDIQAVKARLEGAGWEVRDRNRKAAAALTLCGLLEALAALKAQFSASNSTDVAALKELSISEPDSTIMCWYTLEHYTEATLGVGIELNHGRSHTTLSTDGELISINAFKDGLRITPTKTPFEYFLPAWITPGHSSHSEPWQQALVKSVAQMGNALRPLGESKFQKCDGPGRVEVATLEENVQFGGFVLRIYSDIINSMVVKIMQPESDFRASERIFRMLIDCWRTLYWFTARFPCVRKAVVSRVKNFTEQPKSRNKKAEPNIGCLLALRTVVNESEVPMLDFFHAYIEESFLRGVMWWKGKVAENPASVFAATKVSRRLFLFQSLFLNLSLTPELDETAKLADNTECKLSGRLDNLLNRFKQEVSQEETRLERGAHAEELFGAYFEACHCPHPEATEQLVKWISSHIQKAAVTEGYHFSNKGGKVGGERRGNGGGKQRHNNGR